MNRLLFLTVALLSLPSLLLAQSIKDFYLPVEAFNKTNLYTPDPRTGNNTGMEASIWFINKGSNYDIMEAKLFKGKATSITTETVSITSNEVLLLKTVNTNALSTNKQKTYSPPQTKLKMPEDGQKETWSYYTGSGDQISCTSELIDLRVKGELKKVLKVTNQIFQKGVLVDWATTVDFYAFGIGLYKRETIKGELLEILSDQIFDKEVEKVK